MMKFLNHPSQVLFLTSTTLFSPHLPYGRLIYLIDFISLLFGLMKKVNFLIGLDFMAFSKYHNF